MRLQGDIEFCIKIAFKLIVFDITDVAFDIIDIVFDIADAVFDIAWLIAMQFT